MKKALLVYVIFLGVALASTVTVTKAYSQTELADTLRELLSNPTTFLIFLIQLGLGFGLGYFSLKALKYIIAIVCLLALGVLLNIWQFGGLQGLLEKTGYAMDFAQLIATLTAVASLLGILTILPIGIGFFLGIIVAARK
jgi:hypothetical protein